jgi:hypothetical protein
LAGADRPNVPVVVAKAAAAAALPVWMMMIEVWIVFIYI